VKNGSLATLLSTVFEYFKSFLSTTVING